MTPEQLRQEVDAYLVKQNIPITLKSMFKVFALWAYNEGLKARDSVKATEKIGTSIGDDCEEHA